MNGVKYLDLIDIIKKDSRRLDSGIVKSFLRYPTFRLIIFFRIGTFLMELNRNKGLCSLLFLFIKYYYRRLCFKTGIQLNFGTKIGGGIHFAHFSCIVTNRKSIIGENCTIYQGVTLGTTPNAKGGAPCLGDNCIVWAGAKILGAVTIGNFAEVGANAVVTHDIPDYGVAAGIPARIIKYKK